MRSVLGIRIANIGGVAGAPKAILNRGCQMRPIRFSCVMVRPQPDTWRFIMKKSIKINALLNAIRQSLSVIFPLITFPYVSRVLGSAEYGRYTFSASIVNYIALLAAFGISNYAVREGARIRDDKNKLNRFASDLFTVNVFTSIVAYALLFILIKYNVKLQDYKYLILAQSLSILLTTIGMDWVNIIYEDFLYITIRYIIIQFFALLSVFWFVKGPKNTLIYCVILVCGSYGGNLINLIYIRKYVHIKWNRSIRIKPYLTPLFLLFINSLATVIYVNSDITMIGMFYGDDKVGIYSLAAKIYNIIKHFINAVMMVVVPRLAYMREIDDKKYREYVQNIMNLLMMFLLPITLGVFMMSRSLIIIAGGEEYLPGNLSLKVLAFSLIFALIGSVCTNCILILNRLEKRCLISTVISASINVGINLILIPTIGIVGAAVTTVIAEMVNMLIQAYYAKKDAGISLKVDAGNLSGILIGSGLVMIVCFAANRIWISDAVGIVCVRVVFAFMVSVIGYGAVLAVTKNDGR